MQSCSLQSFIRVEQLCCRFYNNFRRSAVLSPAVARYRMICLVLVNSHLLPLPWGACNTVPREWFNLLNVSVIILASLLVSPMLDWYHLLLRHGKYFTFFSEAGCRFYNTPSCEHLPVGAHYLMLLRKPSGIEWVYCNLLFPSLFRCQLSDKSVLSVPHLFEQ